MTANARLIPVAALLVLALGDGSMSTSSARAEENCLAAPNTQPPQGSHWYYRTDPAKQKKCWYLRTEGQALQKQVAQEKPEKGTTTEWPAATRIKTAPDQLGAEPLELRPALAVPAASGDMPTNGSIKPGAQGRQAGAGKVAWPDPPSSPAAGKVAWPDPPSPAGADNVAWPDPPSPARGATREAAAESTPEERANQTLLVVVPATAANSNKDAGNDAGVDRQIAEPNERAVFQSDMPGGIALAFASGLVVAGIFLRRIVKMTFAPRPMGSLDRREPAWTTSIASDRTIPKFVEQHRDLAPSLVDNECLDDEVKEALRKLLRVLDGQAA